MRAGGRPERALLALIPAQAQVGEVFQRQSDGGAGLTVLGTGLAPGDQIHWAGRTLGTTMGNSRVLTTSVPAELLGRPGDIEVTVENAAEPDLACLHATFRLLAKDSPGR